VGCPPADAPGAVNRTIARVIYAQIAVTVLGALLAAVWGGKLAVASASAGGAIGFVPSLVYALTVRAAAGGTLEKQWRAGYVAEFLKIVVTLALFAATFIAFAELRFWPLFLTYLGTLGVYWLVLWFDVPVIKQR
jgi:ATP synthase protein I